MSEPINTHADISHTYAWCTHTLSLTSFRPPPPFPQPFTHRFDNGTDVEFRWDKWVDWHGGATIVDSFEHLHLVRWEEAHAEFPGGGAEKWVANSMIRIPGEGGGDGVSVIMAGAGCDAINGTYVVEGK
jgi:hypothetical protein